MTSGTNYPELVQMAQIRTQLRTQASTDHLHSDNSGTSEEPGASLTSDQWATMRSSCIRLKSVVRQNDPWNPGKCCIYDYSFIITKVY